MAKYPEWDDAYWLLVLQLYLRKPVGVKAMYSKVTVKLALELHLEPRVIYEKLFELRRLQSPRLQRLMERYSGSPSRLSRAVKALRRMQGFGRSDAFYEGVEQDALSWELDFKPIAHTQGITPVMLIMVLDLYFRLTPLTMSTDTPEVVELSRLIGLQPRQVVDIMEMFQLCDPWLHREGVIISPLLDPCQQVWNRYGNGSPETLSALAAQLKDYFKR